MDLPSFEVGNYSVRFDRHDEVRNVRSVDVDIEVWLMLVWYPLDARSHSSIAKAISSFALLKCVQESNVLARVIVKAVVPEEARIPPDVLV